MIARDELRAESTRSGEEADRVRSEDPAPGVRYRLGRDAWADHLDARARLYLRCSDAAERIGA